MERVTPTDNGKQMNRFARTGILYHVENLHPRGRCLIHTCDIRGIHADANKDCPTNGDERATYPIKTALCGDVLKMRGYQMEPLITDKSSIPQACGQISVLVDNAFEMTKTII